MLSARTALLLAILAATASLGWAPVPLKPRPPRAVSGWPGWRGLHRTGVSSEIGLLSRWPQAGPRLLWKKTDLGAGYSTPAVTAGRMYVLGTRQGKEQVIALNPAQNGKEFWITELGTGIKLGGPSFPGPRSTPTVDGDRVYALGSDGSLLCLSTAGKTLWRKNLAKDLNGVPGRWGHAESPLIDGEQLICTPGGAIATLVALNKRTGAVVWKAAVPRGNRAAYASAIVADLAKHRHYVQFLEGGLVGISARDGKLLWTYEGVIGLNNCATPIFQDGHVFVSAHGPIAKAGAALLELKVNGDTVTARQVYRVTTLTNDYGGVVYLDGCLYGTNAAALLCLDFKTGKTKWQNPAVGKGSITAANGHLYLRGDRGPLALIAASPAAYTEKSRFDPPHRSRSAARPAPVIADGRLYVRDQEALLCFDLKNE